MKSRVLTLNREARRFPLFVLLIALALSVFPFHGASGEEKNPRILSLEEALAITSDKNKDIQKAREYRNWVMGRYVEERAAALPQLIVSGHIANDRDNSQKALSPIYPIQAKTRSGEISLYQSVFTWGQVSAAIRAAKVGIETADDELRIYRQAAFRDVSAAYYNILLAKALYAIAVQNLEQKNRHLDQATKKFSAGVATDYDVLVSKVTVENARPDVIHTENLIRLSRESLRFLIGVDQEVDATGVLEAAIAFPYPEFESSVETALRKRPELSDLRHRVAVANEIVTIENAGDKPRLDFKAGIGYRDQDLGPSMYANGGAWTIGLYATYPLFDGLRTRGRVSQARSDLATLKIEEAKLVDAVKLEVRDACNAVREAGEIVTALSGTVEQAERLLSLAEKGYEYGVKTRLDVEDAELNLVQAKGNLSKAKRDYLVACVNLERVKGILGENPGRSRN